jgi:Flp pilus assembly protein TadB
MKKHTLLLVVVLVALVGLTALSLYKYNKQPKGITLTQAVSQRNTALRDVQIEKQLDTVHKQAAANQLAEAKAANATLTADQATLCAQIKAARLVQPLCK